MKACRHAKRLLEKRFDGDLDWAQELRLTRHLEDCRACAALAAAQAQVLDSLDTYRDAPLAHVDVQRFVERVQERIADVPVGTCAAGEVARGARLFPLAAAALIMILLGAAWAFLRGETEPDPLVRSDGPVGTPVAEAPPSDVDFQAERHQAAVDALRGALVELQGEAPDWDAYGQGVADLRAEGWPLVGLLSGLLRDGDLAVARSSVIALGAEEDRIARRRLWSLREDERLGQTAIAQLQARQALSVEQIVELYWDGSFPEATRAAMAEWDGSLALTGARALVEGTTLRRLPVEAYGDAVGLLARAGEAGVEQALAWLEDARWDQGAWAERMAGRLDLDGALDAYVDREDGARWEAAALALARYKPDARWLAFLEKRCNRSRLAGQAFEVLALQPGVGTLELLLEGERNRMISEEAWLAAWNSALAFDSERVAGLARNCRARNQRTELEHLAEVLLLGTSPGVGDALVELARAEVLPARLRCTLVLQAGELGDPAAAAGLQELFLGGKPLDFDLAACVTLALAKLTEADPFGQWLAEQIPADAELQSEVLALCRPETRRSERERRYLIARKLKQALGRRTLARLE
ncbi:MAG: zf-HC2 domain-containing protein [Planctomycetes bacterium]|nr:zf-HC2 domain-containing protein [Planctomycetota bacterium]